MTDLPDLIGSIDPTEVRRAIEAKVLRSSLGAFVKGAWESVTGFEYPDCPHLELMIRHLEGVTTGELSRLLINIPPGIFKTTLVGVLWPAWAWTSDPTLEFLYYSYNSAVATESSVKCRELLRSEWYRSRFQRVAVSPDEDTKQLFKLTAGGSRRAVPIGGSATGLHPDIVVVDDPNSRDNVNSFTERESVREWYFSTLSSRGITKKVRHVVVQQRLHVEDLSGHILAKHKAITKEFGEGSSPWVHVCLPMRFDPANAMQDQGYGSDWRKEPGELLCPEILSEEAVTNLERQLGPSQTRAQLGQDPRRSDSGLFKVSKIKTITSEQLPPLDRMCRAWDLASTQNDGCWTAGTLLGLQRKRSAQVDHHSIAPASDRFFILDCVRQQTDSPLELMRRTAMLDAHFWGNVDLVFEQQPAAAGVLLTKQVRDHLREFNPTPIPPKGSKEQRAEGLASAIAFGELSVVEGDFLSELLAEFERFPALTCDQVDACSLGYLALSTPTKQIVLSAERSTTPRPSERCQCGDCNRPMFQPDGRCCSLCQGADSRHTSECHNQFNDWYIKQMPMERGEAKQWKQRW